MSLPLSIAELCFDSHISINDDDNNDDMLMNTVGNNSRRINELCRHLLNRVLLDITETTKTIATATPETKTTTIRTITTSNSDVLRSISRRIASAVR